jgi:hypothetical protein
VFVLIARGLLSRRFDTRADLVTASNWPNKYLDPTSQTAAQLDAAGSRIENQRFCRVWTKPAGSSGDGCCGPLMLDASCGPRRHLVSCPVWHVGSGRCCLVAGNNQAVTRLAATPVDLSFNSRQGRIVSSGPTATRAMTRRVLAAIVPGAGN